MLSLVERRWAVNGKLQGRRPIEIKEWLDRVGLAAGVAIES